MRLPCGARDVRERRVGTAVRDVVVDRIAEQERVLRHQADLRAQRGLREIAEVMAVHCDASGGDIVEAWQQVQQRRFAGAAHADEGDHLAMADLEIDVTQHGLGGVRIAERHTLQHQASREGIEHACAGSIRDGGRRVEDLEYPLDGRGGLLHGIDDSRELTNRPVEQRERRREREEVTGRHRARDHLVPAVPERAHDTDRGDDLHERLGDLVGAMVLEGQREQAIVHAVETFGLVRLATERLDDLGAGQRLVQQHVELGDLLLRALVDPIEPAPDRPHDHADEREHEQRNERQAPLAREHDDHERQHERHLADGHDEHGGG